MGLFRSHNIETLRELQRAVEDQNFPRIDEIHARNPHLDTNYAPADTSAESPLISSIDRGTSRVTERLLLFKHTNPNRRSRDGLTPLMHASKHADTASLIELLAFSNADVRLLDRHGNSALDYALMSGCLDCFGIVFDALVAGADQPIERCADDVRMLEHAYQTAHTFRRPNSHQVIDALQKRIDEIAIKCVDHISDKVFDDEERNNAITGAMRHFKHASRKLSGISTKLSVSSSPSTGSPSFMNRLSLLHHERSGSTSSSSRASFDQFRPSSLIARIVPGAINDGPESESGATSASSPDSVNEMESDSSAPTPRTSDDEHVQWF